MKGIILQLLLLMSLTAFSQVMSEKDIQNFANQTNSQIHGVDLGDGIKSKGCTSEGRTLIYKYEVPNNWEPHDNLKEDLLAMLKESPQVAELYFMENIDVDYVFLKQKSIAKKVSLKSYMFYSYANKYISIKDHPKAKGVNLEIQIPLGWKVEEGNRPNTVKIFTFLQNSYNIVITDNITFFSRKQAQKYLEENKLEEQYKQTFEPLYKDVEIIEYSLVKIDSYPAVQLKIKAKMELSEGLTVPVIIKQWSVLYEDKIITLHSMSDDNIFFKEFELIFTSITNSIIFPEQYY